LTVSANKVMVGSLCFVTGQKYEARLNKTLLPRITITDVNNRAAHLTHKDSCVVKTVEHK